MTARDHLLHELGRAVRDRRSARGLTLRELSDKAGVSTRFLADLEAGRGNISVLRLHDVAVALGTSAAGLLDAEARRASATPTPIALLGLRGAGKSTVGKKLARKLHAPFVELDAKVEQAAGLSLREVFELHGEAHYRRLEREVLRRVLDEHPACVIATGGSIVMDEDTFALLRAHALTVWLQASPESHWSRVVAQGDRRPMHNRANAKAELAALLEERRPRYAKAQVAIDTDALGVDGAVDAIVEARARPR
ncbi:MAG: helix-turn-helix domain-containing protein [Deltaproteobacteria bacterium]|nr:helix-turn-helix domain-containing protein [Deltaproteobacteria bacterium]